MRSRHLSPLVLLLACALAWLTSPAARAQESDPAPAEAEEQSAPAVPGHVGAGYPSPRECMEAFLLHAHDLAYGGDQAGLDEILRALDLTPWLGGDWRQEAIDRSILLVKTLDHTEVVDLEELRGPESSQVLHFDDWEGSPQGHPEIEIEVRFRRNDRGGWVIDANTLTWVVTEGWWDEVRDLPVAEEILAGLPVLERWQLRLRESLAPVLKRQDFVLENWQWIGLVALIVLGILLDLLVRFAVNRLVRRAARSERLHLDESSLANFERPFGIFVIAWVFGGLLPLLGIEPQILGMLDLAASFVMTVAGIWAAIRMVDVLCDYLRARARQSANKFDDMLVPLLRKTLKILVAVVGLVFVTSKLTDQLWSIMAGLSIGSLAVGFAARDSIENLFGTFTVLMDKPFELGDWIIFGDVEGTVEKVGFRSTRVRTFYNSIISVPNRHFISGQVDNMGRRRYRRIKTILGLTYDTPPEKVDGFCEGIRELIRRHPYTRKDYYLVHFTGFGGSALEILLYAFVETPDWNTELREKHRLFNDILRLAERLGVGFAFPTTTIHVAKPEDLVHPDTPESWQAAEKAGAALGRAIAEEGLAPFGGHKPKQAVIEPPRD